jgi:hypothetical protein
MATNQALYISILLCETCLILYINLEVTIEFPYGIKEKYPYPSPSD